MRQLLLPLVSNVTITTNGSADAKNEVNYNNLIHNQGSIIDDQH